MGTLCGAAAHFAELGQNAKLWAEFIDKDTPSKQGVFINFKETPELEKPYIDYLVKNYNYVLEKPFFLRKP